MDLFTTTVELAVAHIQSLKGPMNFLNGHNQTQKSDSPYNDVKLVILSESISMQVKHRSLGFFYFYIKIHSQGACSEWIVLFGSNLVTSVYI